jgi:hypothetical protein
MEIHMSFFFSPSLPSDPADTDVYVENRLLLAVMSDAPLVIA